MAFQPDINLLDGKGEKSTSLTFNYENNVASRSSMISTKMAVLVVTGKGVPPLARDPAEAAKAAAGTRRGRPEREATREICSLMCTQGGQCPLIKESALNGTGIPKMMIYGMFPVQGASLRALDSRMIVHKSTGVGREVTSWELNGWSQVLKLRLLKRHLQVSSL